MKILLTTLNAKYVHSNLAIKYLYTVTANEYSDVEIREFTINNDPSYIYGELIRANYDMVCFSCYIWNIEEIKKLCADLKQARPQMYICLGGPEVSFDGPQFALENPWADFIICGEGEYGFYRLCQIMMSGEGNGADGRGSAAGNVRAADERAGNVRAADERARKGRTARELGFSSVPGLIYRQDGKIWVNGQMEPMDFNSIPFPYSIIDCRSDQVIYYESMRGCPFRCTYCLSSVDKTMRPLRLDRVKSDLGYFLYKKVMQVKFIDRTFNYDGERAYDIFHYLMENDNGVTNFQFELCGDLLDERTLRLLSGARKGLFQFEIGIQSANPRTLAAVNRRENIYPTLYNIGRLLKPGNIHIHVDLIAGLPYETYELFERSFNKVYGLGADMLQLGFLKVLKGTPIRSEAEKYGIVYRSEAPYEVISTEYISAAELVRLHMIGNMVDIYYNRGGFRHTLDYLIGTLNRGAFGFYEILADFYYDAGYQNRSRKKEDHYRILRQFAVWLEEQQSRTSEDGAGAGDMRGRDGCGDAGLTFEVEKCLKTDLEETFQPEECRRFEKKGWRIEP